MTSLRAASVFAGFLFPPEVISVAVRWYLRHGLSYRDAEELLAERGITVDHVTAYRWVQRFTPEFIEAAAPCRHAPAARRFFARALRAGTVTVEVTTDRAPAYPRVIDELAPSALRTVEQHANNPIETDHGRLKARLRPMRGLRRRRSARVLAAGRAFAQNLRRGHYDIAIEAPARHRLRIAFDELAVSM